MVASMIDPSEVPGSSGMSKRRLSSDDVPQETKKVFDFTRNVQLIEGTYLGEMKRVWVASLSPPDRKRYVPQSVLDSHSVTLKTLNLPMFYVKNSGLDKASNWWKRHVETLDKIEDCYLKRDDKKSKDSMATEKDTGSADASVKTKSEIDSPIIKKAADVDEFQVEFKEPTSASIEVFTCGFLSPPKGLSAKQYCVELLDKGDVAMGKVVAVFFSSNAVDEWMSEQATEKKQKCDVQMTFKLPKRMRHRSMSIDTIWLRPGEGAIFQRENMAWKVKVHYQTTSINVKLQTLVYEKPLIAYEHIEDITISEGELFLSEEVIKTVYQHYCGQDRLIDSERSSVSETLVWQWCTKDSLPKFIRDSMGSQQKQFFYHMESTMHTVAVFMFSNNGYFACYIHETLDFDNEVATDLRKEIEDVLKALYLGERVYLMYPSFKIQLDYESCGVMAIEAMNLMREQTKRLINDLHAFTIQKKSRKMENKVGVFHLKIPTDKLPVEFLKYYQGSLKKLSELTLEKKVEGQKTLRKLLEKNRKPVESPDGKEKLTVNLLAFEKRYEMMNVYDSLKSGSKVQKQISAKLKGKETAPKKQYTEEQKKRALVLRSQGKKWSEVEDETGVPHYVVRHYQKKQQEGEERRADSEQASSAGHLSASVSSAEPEPRRLPSILPIPAPIPVPILIPVLIPVPVPVPVPIMLSRTLPAPERDDSADAQQ